MEALDQVRMTVLVPLLPCKASTFFASFGCTYGPFLIERDIFFDYLLRFLRTIILFVRLFLRVTNPRAGFPHGVLGPGIPMGERPSPPP